MLLLGANFGPGEKKHLAPLPPEFPQTPSRPLPPPPWRLGLPLPLPEQRKNIKKIHPKRPPSLRRQGGFSRRGGCGGVKQGRFVILRFPLFCSVGGSQDTQMPGKTARKVSLSHLFLCARNPLLCTFPMRSGFANFAFFLHNFPAFPKNTDKKGNIL